MEDQSDEDDPRDERPAERFADGSPDADGRQNEAQDRVRGGAGDQDSTRATRSTVRHLSLDILLRTPTPAEVRMFVGFPLRQVASRMMASLEAHAIWVEEQLLYFLLLDNFRPQTKTIRELPARLRSGDITAHGAIAEIMMSTGFSLRNPGNDTFVTVVLEQGIGMRVQDRKNRSTLEAGKRMYDGYKTRFLRETGDSQSDIVKIVTRAPAFTRFLLDRHHRVLLRGPLPDSPVAKTQVRRVHEDPGQFFTVLLEWISSPEYLAQMKVKRPRSDNQFIRSLYFDLLGRAPDYQEFRNMRNALLSMADPAPLRSVMAKVMLDSGKAELPELRRENRGAFVKMAFLRYLGRGPTQDEMGEFTRILGKPGAEAKHVIRALITSPEYQYY